MRENTQDGTPGSWFKITIPYGGKYDKTWLVNSIQDHCSVPFTPVDFHYVKNQARFFVQDAGIASALKDVSYKICDEENQKISIFVNPSNVPYSVRYKLKPEEMKQLKLTMHKRYDVSHEALDLQSLRFDPDLVGHDIDIILNRRNCMAATLQIIEENFPALLSLNLSNNKLYQLDGLSDIIQMVPTVKILNLSKNELTLVWELNKMKGLKLEELWLEGNPLCDTFPDQSTYISAIRECFPKLLHLVSAYTHHCLLLTLIISISALKLIGLESSRGSEKLKSLILQFLQQSSLCKYFKESRNMKKIKDPYLRVQLLKHTKHDIVCSLSTLPKTQHDISSFVVDMWFHTVSTFFLPRAALESHRWVGSLGDLAPGPC
uniref:Nuclear RNA export factor Tap RNA-binding domain-containing protein n=1 Tax=Panthera tigris altaica TaxID=74533 RepID=A0A8C9MCE5_PANTA